MKKSRWQVPLTLVFIFMGILISLQFQAQSRIASDLTMQRTENLIAMVRGLSDKRQKLAVEIVDLNQQLRSQMESYRDETKLKTNLKAELDKLNILTGNTPLEGSGLTITISQNMPVLYIDLIHITNELWAAGAEAISINEYRITNNTSIFFGEEELSNVITVNNHRLSFPIIIRALGDSNNLEKGLTMPGGIMDRLALFNAYPFLEQAESLTIPASQDVHYNYFLKEYKPPENEPAINTADPHIPDNPASLRI